MKQRVSKTTTGGRLKRKAGRDLKKDPGGAEGSLKGKRGQILERTPKRKKGEGEEKISFETMWVKTGHKGPSGLVG